MDETWKTPFTLYNFFMSKADSRLDKWPLMGSPFPILTLIASYVYFVKVLGPAWMKNKHPFQIEKLVVLYNVLMVLANGFLFFYGGSKTYLGKYNWLCEPIDYSASKESMLIIRLAWWFFILKIIEFADTIFFVLRKKFSHITVLHVIHHSAVAWGVWIGVRFGAGGNNAFFPFVNCFIHMIMYSYYCLSAFGERMQKYLWWKRYLTIMQMVQFAIVFSHAMIPLLTSCNYHPGYAYGLMFHAVLFMVLFLNFYSHAYVKNARKIGETLQNHNLNDIQKNR